MRFVNINLKIGKDRKKANSKLRIRRSEVRILLGAPIPHLLRRENNVKYFRPFHVFYILFNRLDFFRRAVKILVA